MNCDLCRTQTRTLRPVCIENREHIPNMCSDCALYLDCADRTDRERDAKEFGYAGFGGESDD